MRAELQTGSPPNKYNSPLVLIQAVVYGINEFLVRRALVFRVRSS
jgi:hypothetical protein